MIANAAVQIWPSQLLSFDHVVVSSLYPALHVFAALDVQRRARAPFGQYRSAATHSAGQKFTRCEAACQHRLPSCLQGMCAAEAASSGARATRTVESTNSHHASGRVSELLL